MRRGEGAWMSRGCVGSPLRSARVEPRVPTRPGRSSICLWLTEWGAETARPDATLYRSYPHGCIIPPANEYGVFRPRYPREDVLSRSSFFLSLVLAVGLSVPTITVPTEASAQAQISISVGTNLNRGRGITCSQGERLLRSRGFRDVRRIDCRGRFFVYHARRGNSRFEISIRQRDGRVVDMRRIGGRR